MSKGRSYRVEWSASARKDLTGIVEHIAIDSIPDALNALERIREQADALKTLLQRGRVLPELAAQGIHTYYEKVIAPWRLIYRISNKCVYVFAVIDSRRNIEDILLDRLVREKN